MTGRCRKRDRSNGLRRDDDYGIRKLAPDAVRTKSWPHDSSSEYNPHKSSVTDEAPVAQYVSVPAGYLSDAVYANNVHDGNNVKDAKMSLTQQQQQHSDEGNTPLLLRV